MLIRERYNGEPTSWRHADGRQTPSDCGTGWGLLGDEVACPDVTDLKIRNYATGATESVPRRENRTWSPAISPTQVLASEKDDVSGRYTLHLLGRANEPRKDVPVTGVGTLGGFAVVASDAQGAIVEYWDGGEEGKDRHGYLDYATATLKELPQPAGGGANYNKVALGSKWIAMVQFDAAIMVSRADPAVIRTLRLPYPKQFLPVGDWLIADTSAGWDTSVSAYPLDGSAPRKVLDWLDGSLVLGSDGSAYGLSTTNGSSRWAVHRISLDAHGAPRAQEALALAPRPAQRNSIAFAQGGLSALHVDRTQSVLGYRVSTAGPLSVAQAPVWRCDTSREDPLCQHAAAATVHGNVATGDGRIVGLAANSTSCSDGCVVTAHVRETRTGGAHRTVKLPGYLQQFHILNASGRYVLVRVTEQGTTRLLVLDIDAGKVLDTKPAATAGLWGSLLWQPEGDKGIVAATDLRTGQVTRRVDLGSGCRPHELQANGDWFYSACSADGSGAAAHHAPSGRRIPLPFVSEASRVVLGDGYVVQEGPDHLMLYNLRSGTAVKEYESEDRWVNYGLGWAIDRFGGGLAHMGKEETAKVVGVTGAASPLAVIDQNLPGTLDARSATGRQARWWLSKPASYWKLILRNPTSGISTVVRTGGETRGAVDLSWDGKDQSGRTVANGVYEWTLLANPADGKGGQLTATGSVTLTGGDTSLARPGRR